MNVLIDTSVWSLALRRRPHNLSPHETAIVAELTELIKEGRATIVGTIRQELLSGIKSPAQFEKLRATLQSFPDEPLHTADYEAAADAYNLCRSNGIAVSSADILMCAIAISRGWSIFTADPDFENYSKYLPIQIHAPRA